MAGFTGITWQNDVTPVSASNMQRFETFIEQLEGDTGNISLAGSGGGTANLRQLLQGTFKLVYINTTSFQNSGGSAQTITLPVAFTSRVNIWCSAMPVFQLTLSSSPVTYSYYTGISSSGFAITDISTFDKTDVEARSQGANGAFDKISFNGSQGSASTGICTIWGI